MKKVAFVLLVFFVQGLSLRAQESYQLIWADEFSNTGKPAPENWDYDLGDHGWGNNELQNYTSSLTNAEVKDGKLIIRALKENEKWSSARLVTRKKADFLYGRIEVSAKLPKGKGTWPAIWMLPTDWEYGGWPESGEIDIMEHVGYDPAVVHGTVHTAAYNHVKGTQLGNSMTISGFNELFHRYSVEWTPEKIDFYIDDQKYFTFKNDGRSDFMTWPFNKRFHILLNIAIGGGWGGKEGIDPELKEAVMEIDYVRVYQFR